MSKFDIEPEDQKLVKKVTAQLDEAELALSDSVKGDIAQARMNALREARAMKSKGENRAGWQQWFKQPTIAIAAPATAAVLVTVLISYDGGEAIPMLPVELITGEVTTDDLALVENIEFAQDLEFATWLAEQNQEVLL